MGLVLLLLVGAGVWVTLGTLAIVYRMTHPPRMTYGVAVGRQWPTSPADAGMDFTETLAVLSDQTTSPVWLIKGQKADGPLIVVSHGWSHSRFATVTLAKALWPHASRIITYDLRGQGESSARKSHLGTTEIQDLLEILDQFATQPGQEPKPIILAGQSMGGGVSIAAAAKIFESPEHPWQIAGVLVEGVYQLGMQPIDGYFRKHGLPLWPFWLTTAGHLSFWYTRASQFDRAMHAAKLRCPLLVLHGEEDEISPPDSATQIVQAASDAGVWTNHVTFEQAGHLDLQEVDAEKYRNAIDSFMTQIQETLTSAPQMAHVADASVQENKP